MAFTDFMRSDDLDDHESGVVRYGENTLHIPSTSVLYGACIAIGVPEGPWCFQMAFPVGGDPAWRRRINGEWSQWRAFSTD